jgi:hypothetical protein
VVEKVASGGEVGGRRRSKRRPAGEHKVAGGGAQGGRPDFAGRRGCQNARRNEGASRTPRRRGGEAGGRRPEGGGGAPWGWSPVVERWRSPGLWRTRGGWRRGWSEDRREKSRIRATDGHRLHFAERVAEIPWSFYSTICCCKLKMHNLLRNPLETV